MYAMIVLFANMVIYVAGGYAGDAFIAAQAPMPPGTSGVERAEPLAKRDGSAAKPAARVPSPIVESGESATTTRFTATAEPSDTAAATSATSVRPQAPATTAATSSEPAREIEVTVPSGEAVRAEVPRTSRVRETAAEEVLAPQAPADVGDDTKDLTAGGIVAAVNAQRLKRGLQPLSQNAKLQDMAQRKLDDMFNRDYFAHVSPEGVGIGQWAQRVGYAYLLVGENLASGNFETVEQLTEAWLQSPGHRENMLNERYRETGVAVGEGEFRDKRNWLAVQMFGLPRSVCTYPSQTLKEEISELEEQLAPLKEWITARRAELEEANPSAAGYDADVREFNARVVAYNNLLARQKTAIATYNAQVDAYNNCVEARTR